MQYTKITRPHKWHGFVVENVNLAVTDKVLKAIAKATYYFEIYDPEYLEDDEESLKKMLEAAEVMFPHYQRLLEKTLKNPTETKIKELGYIIAKLKFLVTNLEMNGWNIPVLKV